MQLPQAIACVYSPPKNQNHIRFSDLPGSWHMEMNFSKHRSKHWVTATSHTPLPVWFLCNDLGSLDSRLLSFAAPQGAGLSERQRMGNTINTQPSVWWRKNKVEINLTRSENLHLPPKRHKSPLTVTYARDLTRKIITNENKADGDWSSNHLHYDINPIIPDEKQRGNSLGLLMQKHEYPL